MRSDNICFRDGGAIFVDWNWATFGNPLLDLAGWLPSLACEGGPKPWETRRLAQLVGERFELVRVQADFARLERGLHFTRERQRLSRLTRVEDRRHRSDHRAPFVQLQVDRPERRLVVDVGIVGDPDPDHDAATLRQRGVLGHRCGAQAHMAHRTNVRLAGDP